MTNFVNKERTGVLCKLNGEITQYKCTRASASFVYSKGDQEKLGVVAVAAALAGMGGQAVSATASASAVEEEADFVEFSLNGDRIKGWVWRSPFQEGDTVDVAAEWHGDHYEAYGITRPADKMIALYPHCSRSQGRHIKNTIKWWAIWNIVFFGAWVTMLLYIGGLDLLIRPQLYLIGGPVAAVFVLMFISLSRQYMPFVRLSERVFMTLGLPGAKDIDLVKSSKVQRTAEDAGEFGTFYFRY
jgi:hypothetical protein